MRRARLRGSAAPQRSWSPRGKDIEIFWAQRELSYSSHENIKGSCAGKWIQFLDSVFFCVGNDFDPIIMAFKSSSISSERKVFFKLYRQRLSMASKAWHSHTCAVNFEIRIENFIRFRLRFPLFFALPIRHFRINKGHKGIESEEPKLSFGNFSPLKGFFPELTFPRRAHQSPLDLEKQN